MLVIVLCARFEESRHLRLVFEKAGLQIIEVPDVPFHHKCEILDIAHQKLLVEIYSIERMGPTETSIATVQLLMNRKPHWIFMTGVCAGHPAKASLGDIFVAESAVDIRSGKKGPHGISYDSYIHRINRNLNPYIQSLKEKLDQSPDIWQKLLSVPRPTTQRYKMDVILNLVYLRPLSATNSAQAYRGIKALVWNMFSYLFPSRHSIPRSEIQRNITQLCGYRECTTILDKLIKQDEMSHDEKDDVFYLTQPQFDRVRVRISRGEFAIPDPKMPKVVSGVLGSDALVIADMQIEDWIRLAEALAQRNLIAIEMEGSALYNSTAAINEASRNPVNPVTQTILVKGVSDLASPDKDDQFHDYGKQVSAVFVYQFLRYYGYSAGRQQQENSENVNNLSGLVGMRESYSPARCGQIYGLKSLVQNQRSKTRWDRITLLIVNDQESVMGTGFLASTCTRTFFVITNYHTIVSREAASSSRAFFDFEGHGIPPVAPATDLIFRPDIGFFISDSSLLDYAAISFDIDPKSKYRNRLSEACNFPLTSCCHSTRVASHHHMGGNKVAMTRGGSDMGRWPYIYHDCDTTAGSSGGLIICLEHDLAVGMHVGKSISGKVEWNSVCTTNIGISLEAISIDLQCQLNNTRSELFTNKSSSPQMTVDPRSEFLLVNSSSPQMTIDPRLKPFSSRFLPIHVIKCWIKKRLEKKNFNWSCLTMMLGGLFNIQPRLEVTDANGFSSDLKSDKQVFILSDKGLSEFKLNIVETFDDYDDVSRVAGLKIKPECFNDELPQDVIRFILNTLSQIAIPRGATITHQQCVVKFIPICKICHSLDPETLWIIGFDPKLHRLSDQI